MNFLNSIYKTGMLLLAFGLMAACSNLDSDIEKEPFDGATEGGVLILCQGNLNAGNATLSYYNPETKVVENGVFQRANGGAKLGDTGQSVALHGDRVYVAMENSGIVWVLNAATFQVEGKLTVGQTEHMVNPRYIHFLDSPDGRLPSTKAYITDLYSPYITVFNPWTMEYVSSISTGQTASQGHCSTEQMVQYGDYVFTNCWSYSNKILVIDTRRDEVCDSLVLGAIQPKSMVVDARGKLWVITDGGYFTADSSFGDNIPHLYRIDAATLTVELDQALDTDEANVFLATNPARDVLYVINNDVYRMSITDSHLPVRPFIEAERDNKGRRHYLYAMGVDPHNGEIYLADAVDYSQSGVVYRYAEDGTLLHSFRVGITPCGFAFK